MVNIYHFLTSFYSNPNVFIGTLAYQELGNFRATLVTGYMKCCLPSSFMINLHRKEKRRNTVTPFIFIKAGLYNRPYSDTRYWTGTSLQLRLMRGVFSNANDINLFLMTFPRVSLNCKLVPVQYREYEYGLVCQSKGPYSYSR